MADSKLTALSEVSTLAVDDVSYLVDVSDTTDDAAGSSRKVSLQRLGAFLNPSVCQGRLTLESGVPVSTSDQTGKTTVYFAPHNGTRIAVYDGTRWKLYTFSELSLALGTLTSDKNYDVFIYDNAGTLTLELSAAWTNDTTRADALTTQDGIYVKSGATTRRYLGTLRTTSTTATEDSKAKRFVWNLYNRTRRTLEVAGNTTSWTYNSTTWRQANNNTANQVAFVIGIAGVEVDVVVNTRVDNPAASTGALALALDSTSTPDSINRLYGGFSVNFMFAAHGRYRPSAGYHYVAWLERIVSGASNVTFYGAFSSDLQGGMSGGLEC